jgi:predicted amidophosphoribosyltransferase
MLAEAIRSLARTAGVVAAARRRAVDLVLPPTCLACRHPAGDAGGLCPDCCTRAGFIERLFCERLGTPFPFDTGAGMISPAAIANPPTSERARAVLRYGEVGRELVHLMKYGHRLDLVRPLGRWMARAGAELLADAEALVPVALHWTRLWQRGFNQSAALARAVSTIANVPVHDHVLVLVRAPPPAGRPRAGGAGAQRGGRVRRGARGEE